VENYTLKVYVLIHGVDVVGVFADKIDAHLMAQTLGLGEAAQVIATEVVPESNDPETVALRQAMAGRDT
jgi:hypothetical protein